METQIVAPTRTSASRPVSAMRVEEVVPTRELPALIGLALAEDGLKDRVIAIGISRGGDKAHLVILPFKTNEEDEKEKLKIPFQPDAFGYVAEMASFGDCLVGGSANGIRALRVAGSSAVPAFEALRPMLEVHGPAFLAATRGHLSAPPDRLRWVLGPKGTEVHVQRSPTSFNTETDLTLGPVDTRYAVAAVREQLFLVSSSKRADPDLKHPEWPEPRLLSVCMDNGGGHLDHAVNHVSAPLWPGKTRAANPTKRPSRWYHLVQGGGKTTLVSVGNDRPGHCATFRMEGQVEHSRFARVVFLDALGNGVFLARDAVSGLVRPMGIAEVNFLPREVGQIVRSF